MGFAIFDAAHGQKNYGKIAKKQEEARQSAIKTGTASIDTAFSGFNDDFYNQRAQAYQNYALPELSKQYQQTRNQLMFNLANRGMLHSGAANNQWSDLNRTNAQAKQQIVDTGLGQANDLRLKVEGQKNTLLDQLYQSADPARAAQGATATAASFTPPSTFQPLANSFGNIAQQYYLSALINKNQPTSFVQAPRESTDGYSSPTLSSY